MRSKESFQSERSGIYLQTYDHHKQTLRSLPCGRTASLYTLKNSNGLTAQITNYGGIIVSLEIPDRKGHTADILLGKDSLQGYVDGHPHFACITGRVAGRIGGASFELEGQTYELRSTTPTHHGGSQGFHQILWD